MSYHQPPKNGSFCLFPSPFSTSTFSASPKYPPQPLLWANLYAHTYPFPSSDCYRSHILTPIWWCFPAVRSWGGSLLWLLREENWTSWNALVRLLCYCSNGGGLAQRSWRHWEVEHPKITPRQNTCLFVNGLSLSARFCQLFPLLLLLTWGRRPVVSLPVFCSLVFGQSLIPCFLWGWCTQVYCCFLVYRYDLSFLLDAPQVQCVKSYKARENDELALEKADIIMVMQYSNDGE